MAHFARIEDGIVREVIAVRNTAIDGGDFPDSESLGQALIAETGHDGTWLQCSYSGAFRGAYPGPGFTYDEGADEFVAPPAPPAPPESDPQP